MKDNNELIKRDFLLEVPYLKGGGGFWTCVEDNDVGEKEKYKAIGLRGFDSKLFEEDKDTVGGFNRAFMDIHI